ncbi:hypothetical protein ACSBR1_012949 [Camellia fascicularis]
MWMHSQPTVNHPAVFEGTMAPPMNRAQWSLRGQDGITKTIPSGSSDKTKQIVCSLDGRASPVLNIIDELPMIVIRTLTQGSCVLNMGFRPILPMVLLVGLWEKLVSLSFRIWNDVSISTLLKSDLVKDSCAAVNYIKWSPTGSLFGELNHPSYIYMEVSIYSYRV